MVARPSVTLPTVRGGPRWAMLVPMTDDRGPARTGLEVRHVLLPLDGSEFALQAMPTARVLAERFDADLHSVSVATNDEEAAHLHAVASAALGASVDEDRAVVVNGGEPAEVIASR